MIYIRFSCISLAIAVVLGSMGAHAMKPLVSPEAINSWDTAVKYQFYQSIGLLLLSIAGRLLVVRPVLFSWALRVLTLGIVFFSGSLYLRSSAAVTGFDFTWLGPIAPIGGLLFIAGWILAACSFKNDILPKSA
ncbi:MAG: DUF423 domain-containing protein [Flavobacteriales bacterium]